MNLKLLLGQACSRPLEALIAARWFPLFRSFRLRREWLYDVCRFAATRDFATLFDVGANIGQTSVEMHRYFPHATIHAFEPVGTTFRQLEIRMQRCRNVHPHCLAVGRRTEQRQVRLQDSSVFNSLQFSLPAEENIPPGSGMERVNVTTVENFCAERKIEFIDVLKTDAQGSDLDVVVGAQAMIARERICFIYTEVTFQSGDPYNSAFAPLHDHLSQAGFRLGGFYEQCGLGPRLRLLGFCNALYFHPGALQRRFSHSGA